MAINQRQTDLFRVLLAGSGLQARPMYTRILEDLNLLLRTTNTREERIRYLEQVLLIVRPLETSIKEYLRQNRVPNIDNFSLGEMLTFLTNNNFRPGSRRLAENIRTRFQDNLVAHRNQYFHGSGRFPRDQAAVDEYLTEAIECLSNILGL